MTFLVIKAVHILAVISWMAGLLYLPRLFVYHADAPHDSELARTFTVMENRLYRAIMQPAMIVTWITGLWLAYAGFNFSGGWLYIKFSLVLLLSAHHDFQGRWKNALAAGTNTHSARFFRLQNEIPTVLMIGIVLLVILKPF